MEQGGHHCKFEALSSDALLANFGEFAARLPFDFA